MIKVVNESNAENFERIVNMLISEGYKVSSTSCGYTGEIGGNVYDCDYFMAILIKDN